MGPQPCSWPRRNELAINHSVLARGLRGAADLQTWQCVTVHSGLPRGGLPISGTWGAFWGRFASASHDMLGTKLESQILSVLGPTGESRPMWVGSLAVNLWNIDIVDH